MFFCKKQINKYFNVMIKKNLIKLLILLFFVSACGYTPIYTSKNSSFAITQLNTTGNNKLNRIISEKLGNYKDTNASKQLTLTINTSLSKEVSSKDSKGNPKTYRINLKSNVTIIDIKGNKKNKLFIKSIDYSNKNSKSDLKKLEDKTSKNLMEKIAEDIIVYLQSI